MIRAKKLSLVHAKRTCIPLYGHHQATPYAAFLDSALITGAQAALVVYPGMVAVKTTGEQVKVIDTATDVPFGLFANFINGDLDELGDSAEVGVWRGGPDATFEITGDALDSTVTWTSLNSTEGGVLLYANPSGTHQGKLTNTDPGSGKALARLIEAPSNTKIIVSLLLTS